MCAEHSSNIWITTGWNLTTNLCSLKCGLVASAKILEESAASTLSVTDYPDYRGAGSFEVLLVSTRVHCITFQNAPDLCSCQVVCACSFHVCCMTGQSCSVWGLGVQAEWHNMRVNAAVSPVHVHGTVIKCQNRVALYCPCSVHDMKWFMLWLWSALWCMLVLCWTSVTNCCILCVCVSLSEHVSCCN